MSSIPLKQFQDQVSELLLRHRSVLDVLSKFHQTGSAVHRATVKAITECGCIEVNAKKQKYSADMTKEQAKAILETHLSGQLCDHCLEIISAELGSHLFYMSALCNVLKINLDEVVKTEADKCHTLGFFNMT